MFLKSILESTTLLTNPHILFLIFLWLFLQSIYLLFIRLATNAKESQDAAAPGCLTLILGVLWNGVGLGGILLFALPIIFKMTTGFSWQWVEPYCLIALRSGLLGVLVMTALSLIPYLGKFIATSPGLETLGAGIVTVRLLSPSLLDKISPFIPHHPYPSILIVLGLFVLFLFFSKLTQLILHLISSKLKNGNSSATQQRLVQDLGQVIDQFCGIFFVLSYGYLISSQWH